MKRTTIFYFYKSTFCAALAVATLAIAAFLISAFTSLHFVSSASMFSLAAGSLKLKFITPGLTYFTSPLGLSQAAPNPFEWLPFISRGVAHSQLDLPLWLPAAASVLIALITHRRAFQSPGLCAHCKYSLHGLEDATRCPECGHSLPANSPPLRPVPC